MGIPNSLRRNCGISEPSSTKIKPRKVECGLGQGAFADWGDEKWDKGQKNSTTAPPQVKERRKKENVLGLGKRDGHALAARGYRNRVGGKTLKCVIHLITTWQSLIFRHSRETDPAANT